MTTLAPAPPADSLEALCTDALRAYGVAQIVVDMPPSPEYLRGLGLLGGVLGACSINVLLDAPFQATWALLLVPATVVGLFLFAAHLDACRFRFNGAGWEVWEQGRWIFAAQAARELTEAHGLRFSYAVVLALIALRDCDAKMRTLVDALRQDAATRLLGESDADSEDRAP